MGWDEASCWWRRETAWRRSCQQRKKICISLGLAKRKEGRPRLKKRRTERDFYLGEKTEDTIRSHFGVDNKQVSECYAFEINFHVLFHLAIHILMILLCYYLSKN